MDITCAIVEDEPLAMERIAGYVQRVPWLRLAASFSNGIDALVQLRQMQVDLAFLDINLGEISGIGILESGPIASHVILTTAYPDYALKGYDLHVADYLLKPFSFERFLQAVTKVQQLVALQHPAPSTELEYIFVKTEHRLEKILLRDILYIQGMRDYRCIYTTAAGRIMTLQTFGHFEKTLPPHVVCRVHKSYMVGIAHIQTLQNDTLLVQGREIPISDTYRKEVLQRLRI